jgi:hypothetical protein
MEPKYITFEQAKWLKEKGFDVPVKSMYHDEEFIYGGADYNHNNKEEQKLWNCLKLSAPEQWQVVEWLELTYQKYAYAFRYNGIWQYKIDAEHGTDYFSTGEGFKSKQEAYSAAFDYIKNNNLI